MFGLWYIPCSSCLYFSTYHDTGLAGTPNQGGENWTRSIISSETGCNVRKRCREQHKRLVDAGWKNRSPQKFIKYKQNVARRSQYLKDTTKPNIWSRLVHWRFDLSSGYLKSHWMTTMTQTKWSRKYIFAVHKRILTFAHSGTIVDDKGGNIFIVSHFENRF